MKKENKHNKKRKQKEDFKGQWNNKTQHKGNNNGGMGRMEGEGKAGKGKAGESGRPTIPRDTGGKVSRWGCRGGEPR